MKKTKDAMADYSAPAFADPARLVEFRNSIHVGQIELAKASGVSQGHISAIERGDKPFSEPARTKIWTALAKLNKEYMDQELNKRNAAHIPTGAEMAGQTFNPFALYTPLERAQIETIESRRVQEEYEKSLAEGKESIEGLKHQIAVLEQERGNWMKQAEAFRKMAEMNIGPLVERIAELEKKYAEAIDLVGKRSEQVAKESEAYEARARADEAQRRIEKEE